MSETLDKALGEVATLPVSDQDEIGRQLLAHVEKLRLLRHDIDKGIRSLDEEGGCPLDIEAFLAAQHVKHERP